MPVCLGAFCAHVNTLKRTALSTERVLNYSKSLSFKWKPP